MSLSPEVPPFADALALLHTTAELGAFLKAEHARLNAPAALAAPEDNLLLCNTALCDAMLRRLYALALERVPDTGSSEQSDGLAIVATGGYGRREMAPFSDVDITFVAAREDDPRLNAILKEMFQQVMDVFLYGAGLKVGYAYRVLGEGGQLDHQTQTALLDARFLCGDEGLFREFRARFREQLLTADFLFRKWAERRGVLAKQNTGDSVYSVEPNVKEGAGGLRDLHNAEWCGEVCFQVGLRRVWETLTERGLLLPADSDAARSARAFLLRVRSALHIVSGEARDVLTAEKQEAVAPLLGYTDSGDVPAVETFMRDFYAHAGAARHVSRRALEGCLESPLPLGVGLGSVGCALRVTDEPLAMQDAALPLHAAELAQAYGLSVPPETHDHLRRFLEAHPAPAEPAYAGRVFTRLLTAGRDVCLTLRSLEEQGTLAWLLPEFGNLMTLIPYDAAHDYTVGAHLLRTVGFLEDLRTVHDPRLFTLKRLAGEIALPEVLYLAGLLHDVGKQWPDGAHEKTGAEAAERIAVRLGWDGERVAKLVFLVRHHLLMAETSRLRDLALDETVQSFLRYVPDLDSLNMLYLLTYADTNAVGAGIWTEVKARFLGELYGRAEAVLAGDPVVLEDGAPAPPPSMTRQRDRIRKGLARRDLPPDLVYEHTRSLSAQYLLNTPLEEMHLHIAMVGRLRETFQPIVDFQNEYGAEYTELTLCAYDDPRPGLLAKITGVLYGCDVNLHSAQVFTRDASVRIAIDTLWVDFRGKPLSAGKRTEVQDALWRVLTGQTDAGEFLSTRRKPSKDQTVYSATIDDAASERFSLLEISAPDETGVVYRLTRAISALGWNIHSARLSVWGSRARDAFYVTGADGQKLPPSGVSELYTLLPLVPYSRLKRPAR